MLLPHPDLLPSSCPAAKPSPCRQLLERLREAERRSVGRRPSSFRLTEVASSCKSELELVHSGSSSMLCPAFAIQQSECHATMITFALAKAPALQQKWPPGHLRSSQRTAERLVSSSGNGKDNDDHEPNTLSTTPVCPQSGSELLIPPVECAAERNNSSGSNTGHTIVPGILSASESCYKFNSDSSNRERGEYSPSDSLTTRVFPQISPPCGKTESPPAPPAESDKGTHLRRRRLSQCPLIRRRRRPPSPFRSPLPPFQAWDQRTAPP